MKARTFSVKIDNYTSHLINQIKEYKGGRRADCVYDALETYEEYMAHDISEEQFAKIHEFRIKEDWEPSKIRSSKNTNKIGLVLPIEMLKQIEIIQMLYEFIGGFKSVHDIIIDAIHRYKMLISNQY